MSKLPESFREALPDLDIDAGRREFLRYSGLATAGLATIGAAGLGLGVDAAEAQTIDDPTILNFALNLEYLEAEFYLRAAYGTGLPSDQINGVGTTGGVSGGRQVEFQDRAVANYAKEIAIDEQRHVRFLRSALGGAAVARPQLDINAAFTSAARAARLVGPNETFDAYADDTSFLLAAFIFEDVGVTAYKGAARFISNKDYLEAAAGILAVEAYHAGEIRTLLYGRGLYDAARQISYVRDVADGIPDLDQGVGTPDVANIIPTDLNGLAYSRTPQQVLNIVYLGGQAANFGFFPNRLNGAVR